MNSGNQQDSTNECANCILQLFLASHNKATQLMHAYQSSTIRQEIIPDRDWLYQNPLPILTGMTCGTIIFYKPEVLLASLIFLVRPAYVVYASASTKTIDWSELWHNAVTFSISTMLTSTTIWISSVGYKLATLPSPAVFTIGLSLGGMIVELAPYFPGVPGSAHSAPSIDPALTSALMDKYQCYNKSSNFTPAFKAHLMPPQDMAESAMRCTLSDELELFDDIQFNRFKHSVLHFSALRGCTKDVGYLIDPGKVDQSLQDDHGMTAINYAAQAGHNEIIALLGDQC